MEEREIRRATEEKITKVAKGRSHVSRSFEGDDNDGDEKDENGEGMTAGNSTTNKTPPPRATACRVVDLLPPTMTRIYRVGG